MINSTILSFVVYVMKDVHAARLTSVKYNSNDLFFNSANVNTARKQGV